MSMEYWDFPPRYDDSYKPPANSRYWFVQRETMAAGDRERAILQRLQAVCHYAYANSVFYRRHWDNAGFHPSQLRSLEDFEDRVPVVSKLDLRESQARAAPFGEYLCIAREDVFRVHGTSGTTGRPTAFAIGRNDWQSISNAHARVMWGMGLRPGAGLLSTRHVNSAPRFVQPRGTEKTLRDQLLHSRQLGVRRQQRGV